MQTYNMDIVGLYNRINRFIKEIAHQVSSNLSETNQFDFGRIQSYLGAIRSYALHVQNDPELDLPETSPRLYELREPPVVPDVENESLADMMRYLVTLRDELTNSQSARRAAKLVSFDYVRLQQVLDKCDRFMDDYIATVTPLDLPESSPRAMMTPEGKKGI